MTRYLFGFMCVLALGLMGCGERSGTGGNGGDGGVAEGPCLRPLNEYCGYSRCPTYEQAIAAAKRSAEHNVPCDTCDAFTATYDAGRCGDDLRYVRVDCGDDHTEFFEASGTLVAAYLWSDQWGFACWGSWAGYFGFRPECELEQEQDFCDQGD